MPKRIGIFCFFDPDGIVDHYVTFLLDSFQSVVDRIIIVCNSNLMDDEKNKFYIYSREIVIRENIGFDGGAYQEILLKYINKKELEKYDELILMNDTFFGPFYSFDMIFDKMRSIKCDIWGLSKHEKYMSGINVKSPHIQSYFITIKKNVFLSDVFWEFWENMKVIQDFDAAVDNFEVSFSEKMLEAGFVLEAYCKADPFISDDAAENYNYAQLFCGEIIRDYGFPILKRKCLVAGYPENDSPILALEYIKSHTSYDVDMIWENLLRRYDLSDIRNSLALQYIIDESHENDIHYVNNKIGLILFIYNKKELQSFASYKKSIPNGVKVYYLGIDQKIIPGDISHYGLGDNFEIRNLKKENTEQIIFSRCKDLFLKYDYLCVLSGEASDNKTLCSRQLMMSESYSSCLKNTTRILSLFEENDRLGVLFPSSIRTNYRNWSTVRYTESKEFCEQNGIAVKFHEGKKILECRTSFWCRTKVLENYILGDIFNSFTDIEWKNWIRCLPYIFQANGYYCGYLSTVEQSQRMIAQDEIEIQKWLQAKSKYNILSTLAGKILENTTKHIYIYGCGIVANRIYDVFEASRISVDSFIISDSQEKETWQHGKKIIWLSEYVDAEDNVIIVGVGNKLKHEIMDILDEKGYQYITL